MAALIVVKYELSFPMGSNTVALYGASLASAQSPEMRVALADEFSADARIQLIHCGLVCVTSHGALPISSAR
jgi:hypothetical protein